MKDKWQLKVFLKGVLMGICDIIPGISGGTIAFITGIYDRLINAVKSFSPELAVDFFKYLGKRNKNNLNTLKNDINKLDLGFLGVLGLGIAIAIISMSRVLQYLLANQYVFTISFFIGLILASSKSIYDHIKNHKPKNVLFGGVGLLIGILLAFFIPASIMVTTPYLFLGGFLAISAMFLPGISGAFILLIMGLYEHVLGMLHDIGNNLLGLSVFSIGAVLGAFGISRIVSFLFKKDRCKTLYVLLGLVVGALSIPVKNIFSSSFIWSIWNTMIVIVLLLLGIASARYVANYKKNRKC